MFHRVRLCFVWFCFVDTRFTSSVFVVLQVRINTGKNTMLKFSERKEQKEHSKRKKKNGHSNGHSHHELHKITTPVDIYR